MAAPDRQQQPLTIWKRRDSMQGLPPVLTGDAAETPAGAAAKAAAAAAAVAATAARNLHALKTWGLQSLSLGDTPVPQVDGRRQAEPQSSKRARGRPAPLMPSLLQVIRRSEGLFSVRDKRQKRIQLRRRQESESGNSEAAEASEESTTERDKAVLLQQRPPSPLPREQPAHKRRCRFGALGLHATEPEHSDSVFFALLAEALSARRARLPAASRGRQVECKEETEEETEQTQTCLTRAGAS
ncbi:hypothetical protein Efla_003776 [Eimeria flavescens]